ncbi:MAG: polysaccharide biosynthesis tyrosine autokinase [Candidatus Thiothrix putei]|uniref:non-specific protein-tyrosine kinase n=1 Tax=Candidatus Thiothrix putei TaxID=3080811 RepID=A0AA95HD56_9GAMM|nr:MAG: polysaccharide biosynthesis tyrosine autokinase [Candidatus Thiothrix putei]
MQNDQHNRHQTSTYAPDLLKKPDTLDLREFGRTLLRRRRMIMLITALTLLLALLITLLSKPVYRATATLQIERESSKVVNIDNILGSGDIRDTRDFYQTQFELIRSRALAAQVITKLKLEEKLSSTSIIGQIKAWFNTPDANSQQTALEDLLLDNLTVEPVKNSRLVAISYTSSDPTQAADIANAVVSTFKDMNTERRLSATTDASEYLDKTVQETKTLLDESEQRLNQYAREHEIFQLDGEESTTSSLALKQLSEELIKVQKQRIEQESKYEILTDKSRTLNDRIGVLEKDASYLQAMQQRLDKLKAQQEKQTIANLSKEITKLEKDIEIEVDAKRDSLKNELETTKRKESMIREGITKAKTEAMQEQDKTIAYSTLKREVTTNQELYQNLQQRLKEINIAGGVVANNIAIIDPAQTPLKKFKPNLSTNLLFGGLLGLLLGISAAFMREFLDDTVKDINELERVTQLPVLGVMAETTDANTRQLATATISKPRSVIAEAFRSLRTSLRFSHQRDDTPIIFITSTSPNEGKTTTASNLACAYASAGNRVLLIDADLRNPSLHKTLGIHAPNGLANYLSGALDNRELIQTTDIPNLYLLPAGSLPDDPAELLSSPHMHSLLASAKRDFDQIILDGPPVLGLADALILASQSSATLLTVRAEYTRMVMLENALTRLRRAQAPLVGILLNRVDLNSGYGDDYGGYVYQAEEQQVNPSAVSKWLTALKKL